MPKGNARTPLPSPTAEATRLMKLALANPKPIKDERCLWLPPSARAEHMSATFSPSQRDELKRLGVDAEQLKRLQLALRIIKAYTAAPATLCDVRNPLDDLTKAAARTAKLLNSLSQAPVHDDAMTEAKGRLMLAIYEVVPDFSELTLAQLQSAACLIRDAASHALQEIPRQQSRHKSAHVYPIKYIDDALLLGFTASQNANKEGPWPPYPFKPSASPTSKFRQIVGVCYEAAGAPSNDPERAIKSYMRVRRSEGRQREKK